MRVLHVIPGSYSPTTPSMIFASRQIEALARLGYEHHFHYLSLRMTPRGVMAGYQRLLRAATETKPDIIHAHFGSLTALLCVMTGWRTIISFRGSDINPDPSVSRLRSALQKTFSRIAARRASGAIFVAEHLAEKLAIHCPYIVVPDGIDTDAFKPMDKIAARRALGWPVDDLVVLWNGGRPPQTNKRRDLAVAAVNEANRITGKNIWPHMLDGTTSPDQMPILINASDCVLLTSDYEGSPNTTKEALCCGVPVVAVDVGDTVQQLTGVGACEIAERSGAALGHAIARVIGKMSDGRNKVLTCDQVADRISSFYRQTVSSFNGRPRRADIDAVASSIDGS